MKKMFNQYTKLEKILFVVVGFLLVLVATYGALYNHYKSNYDACKANIEELTEDYNK